MCSLNQDCWDVVAEYALNCVSVGLRLRRVAHCLHRAATAATCAPLLSSSDGADGGDGDGSGGTRLDDAAMDLLAERLLADVGSGRLFRWAVVALGPRLRVVHALPFGGPLQEQRCPDREAWVPRTAWTRWTPLLEEVSAAAVCLDDLAVLGRNCRAGLRTAHVALLGVTGGPWDRFIFSDLQHSFTDAGSSSSKLGDDIMGDGSVQDAADWATLPHVSVVHVTVLPAGNLAVGAHLPGPLSRLCQTFGTRLRRLAVFDALDLAVAVTQAQEVEVVTDDPDGFSSAIISAHPVQAVCMCEGPLMQRAYRIFALASDEASAPHLRSITADALFSTGANGSDHTTSFGTATSLLRDLIGNAASFTLQRLDALLRVRHMDISAPLPCGALKNLLQHLRSLDIGAVDLLAADQYDGCSHPFPNVERLRVHTPVPPTGCPPALDTWPALRRLHIAVSAPHQVLSSYQQHRPPILHVPSQLEHLAVEVTNLQPGSSILLSPCNRLVGLTIATDRRSSKDLPSFAFQGGQPTQQLRHLAIQCRHTGIHSQLETLDSVLRRAPVKREPTSSSSLSSSSSRAPSPPDDPPPELQSLCIGAGALIGRPPRYVKTLRRLVLWNVRCHEPWELWEWELPRLTSLTLVVTESHVRVTLNEVPAQAIVRCFPGLRELAVVSQQQFVANDVLFEPFRNEMRLPSRPPPSLTPAACRHLLQLRHLRRLNCRFESLACRFELGDFLGECPAVSSRLKEDECTITPQDCVRVMRNM